MSNKKLPSITWESKVDGYEYEYVPQFVAAHTHDPYKCPNALYEFDITVHDGNGKPVTETHLGVPYFIGRFEGSSAVALRRTRDQHIVDMQTDIPIDDAQLIPRRMATRLQLFIN